MKSVISFLRRRAVRIGGDKVHWPLRRAQVSQRSLRREPPLVCGAGVAQMAAADHADGVALTIRGDQTEIFPDRCAPDGS